MRILRAKGGVAMKQKPWKAYLWATLPTIAGGVLAGILSGSGGNYENYIKPPLSPPGWLFPVVWAVLYLLMAIGMAMVDVYKRQSMGFPRAYGQGTPWELIWAMGIILENPIRWRSYQI